MMKLKTKRKQKDQVQIPTDPHVGNERARQGAVEEGSPPYQASFETQKKKGGRRGTVILVWRNRVIPDRKFSRVCE
jgi:hypothetical protein